MIEITCIECGHKFNKFQGDMDNRTCMTCVLKRDDPEAIRRDPNIRRSSTAHYPDWDMKKKQYIVPPNQRKESEVK